jgi:Tol biopolymer transport system component
MENPWRTSFVIKGVDNIFVQPFDGSPGRQITNFSSEHIAELQWSPDGKALAVARTHAGAPATEGIGFLSVSARFLEL